MKLVMMETILVEMGVVLGVEAWNQDFTVFLNEIFLLRVDLTS